MSIRWVVAGEVIEGPYCTGQAALLQIGNNGVSWFTTAIAVLTYLQVAHSNPLSKRGAKIFAAGSICFTTVFTLLVIAIPASMVSPYYGNAGLWCWLPGTNPSRQRLRFASQYVWNWLAILVSIAMYGTVAYKWLFRGPFRTNCDIKRAAIAMGWYPITYLIVTAPSSSIRFRQFHGYKPNTAQRIFPFVLAVSHGAINVILWFMTGRRFGFSPKKNNVSPDSEILSFKDVETSTSQATPTDGDGVRHSAVTIPIPPPTWTPERPNGSVPSVTQVSSPPGLSGNDIHMYPCSLSPIPGSPNSDQTIVISNID
ncbi:uncharacterized protein EI90DRAFT_3130729 [Cantharellus anzutake]|uniref:uncharacterized protein n=1 Tax=Cantharellus anzutake TaxID=1750568 RepID=UPI0019089BCA|nr:uncharacterized protein EI90DRAFT_3130729 [Cantharellus anzutake]KAF8322820.1 hypothetical protein EI90DRAFT_3130729 [Cantharellus anzutake]